MKEAGALLPLSPPNRFTGMDLHCPGTNSVRHTGLTEPQCSGKVKQQAWPQGEDVL